MRGLQKQTERFYGISGIQNNSRFFVFVEFFQSVKMLFDVVVETFNKLGINAEQSKKRNPINKRIFVGFVVLFFNALFQWLYVINEAQNFREYIESIYMSSIGTVSFLVLTSTVVKMDLMFRFMEWVNGVLSEIENDKGNAENRHLVHSFVSYF